jgi:hypothetical protein
VINGRIGIDGMYANMLTGLCSPEEWLRMADIIQKINKTCNIKIESAMISDVPGWSWSIVPFLANSGIKYLSCGINQGDRIGTIRKELGDKPFYWISQSGNEKILTWVHEEGYSAFHYIGKSGTAAGISVLEPTIINYTNKLADEHYSYNIIPLRYTIGSDNGPTDKYLADNIKQWNEKYISPKIIISTNAEFFREFEKKYGKQLPEYKGDITPYWEDGAQSSAKETAINRQTADKLSLAMNLFAQYEPDACPIDSFESAWQKVILYDEHTWGSWNSVSEPESDFTKQQWYIKQAFATEAAKLADELFKSAINNLSKYSIECDALEVLNTLSSQRTDIAYLPDIYNKKINSGLSIVDEDGIAAPHQRLADGSIVFLASEIPAFGSKRYFIAKPKTLIQFKPVSINEKVLENEFLKLELDNLSGKITKMISSWSNKNLINDSIHWGLGEYLYVKGRKPDNPMQNKLTKIEIKENGPLISSWHLKFDAPGCNFLEQEIKLIAGINRIELNYTIDKQKIYTPEAVRIAFPFNIPNGVMNIENAFGYYQPETEQIKGSCKNFFALNNYIDISNSDYGISLISPDAPLIEVGALTNDANAVGWLETCEKGTNVYSFLMNNYWHTNYCATQEGASHYRFFLYPHKNFNPAEAGAAGISAGQPLIVIPINQNDKRFAPTVRYSNENIFMVSLQPITSSNTIWVALYNASPVSIDLQLTFSNTPKQIFETDMLKNKLGTVSSSIPIPGLDLKYLLVQF